MSTHVARGVHRRCLVCQWSIEQDHEEALAMELGALPDYFDGAAMLQAIQADELANAIENDHDFVVLVAPGLNPNETQPPFPIVEAIEGDELEEVP
jgi:hypothetical protein